jgi:hypothetical protein
MTMRSAARAGAAILILLCLVMAAGCSGRSEGPGAPAQEPTEPRPTTKIPVTPEPSPLPTPGDGGGLFAEQTCTEQGGTVVVAGQDCTGEWLGASDTFSCCSEKPVSKEISGTASAIRPFDFLLVFDDDPGRITG